MAKTNREMVMLAHTFEMGRDRTAGMFLSEKLDGMRAFWVPQSKGMPVGKIPFANQEKDKRLHTCTGLWSRLGKVIHCPSWFTEGFPDYPLDGELFLGRGRFEDVTSVCKHLEPNESDWRQVEYKVFEAPTYSQLFIDGRINNQHWTKAIRYLECMDALGQPTDRKPLDFEYTYHWLQKEKLTGRINVLDQTMLPFNTSMATDRVTDALNATVTLGGEGVMLRHPASKWEATRTRMLLKVVPVNTAEGTIIGFKSAEYGKDGKLLGRMGSVVLRWEGREFFLSGFTDEERRLTGDATMWALDNPGQLLPMDNPAIHFRKGDVITFSYKELTEDGVPKNGRFKRKA